MPTDFSEFADAARDEAFYLAQIAGGELHLLHSYHTTSTLLKSEKTGKETAHYNEARKELARLKNEAASRGINCKEFLTAQKTLDAIQDLTSEHGYDLVIIGSHGASGIKELFIGSTAQKVVRLSKCPVLVIKEKTPHCEIKKIAVASDFEKNAYKFIPKILPLARLLDAKLDLLFINTPATFEDHPTTSTRIEKFKRHLENRAVSIHIFNHYTEEEGILAFVKKYKPDLLAIGSHRRKGVSQLLTGSIAEKVINHSPVPVLNLGMM